MPQASPDWPGWRVARYAVLPAVAPCGVPNSGDEGGAPRPRHRRGDRSGSELQNRFAGENRFQEPDLHWHQKLFRRSPRSPSLAALSPSLPAAPYELRRAGGVPRVVKSAVLLERFVSPQRWRCRRCSSTGAGRTGRADRAGGPGWRPRPPPPRAGLLLRPVTNKDNAGSSQGLRKRGVGLPWLTTPLGFDETRSSHINLAKNEKTKKNAKKAQKNARTKSEISNRNTRNKNEKNTKKTQKK